MKSDFGCLHHRCLFCNHCLEAHLIGLNDEDPEYQDCLVEPATVLVTFGQVEWDSPSKSRVLEEGQSIRIPAKTPFHLRTRGSADLMLLVGTQAA